MIIARKKTFVNRQIISCAKKVEKENKISFKKFSFKVFPFLKKYAIIKNKYDLGAYYG